MVQSTSYIPHGQEPAKIRVAVATKGTGIVDQHFGHAKEFLIYDVDDTQAVCLGSRPVNSYCHGPENSPGKLDEIISTLGDCQAVLVSKIGVGPDDRLREAGIEPVQVYDAIETAVLDFYQQWRKTASSKA